MPRLILVLVAAVALAASVAVARAGMASGTVLDADDMDELADDRAVQSEKVRWFNSCYIGL